MPPKPKSLLLIEGKDDMHVIGHLCQHHNTNPDLLFEFKDCEGVGGVLSQDFQTMVQSAAPAIGIIVDADTNPNARWSAILSKLKPIYQDLPDSPVSGGLVLPRVKGSASRLGIWLMPNNQTEGMLEDFLLQLTSPDDPLVQHARGALETLPIQRFADVHSSKALLHTWLAWQENPGRPYGLAVKMRVLNPDHATAVSFLEWLVKLFQDPSA